MDKDFADWYRAAGITPTNDLLNKRWGGIEAFTKTLDAPGIVDIARLFYGLTAKDNDLIARFRDSFKTTDPSFPMSGNALELQVLAGSTVAAALSKLNSALADVAALAVLCGDYRGHRHGERLPVFLIRSREYLQQRSAGLRHSAQNISVAIPKESPFKHQEGAPDPNATSRAVAALLQSVGDLATSTAEAVQQLAHAKVLLREESDILWWLFGGYSRDQDCPLSEFDAAAACLIVGKELADLIAVLPGPASATAIMDRMLHGTATERPKVIVTLLGGVQRAPLEWLKRWTAGNELVTRHGDICPTLMAAQRSIETPGSDAWIAGVEQVARISVRSKFEALGLAGQCYDEHRLLRAIKLAG